MTEAVIQPNMSNWKEEILNKWMRPKKKGVEITDRIRDRLAREFKGDVLYREPMSRHTTIRIGGMADVYLKPKTIEDISSAVTIACESSLPYLIVGAGSNLLVKDGGIRGFVIALSQAFSQFEVIQKSENNCDVKAGAGMGMTGFVHRCREEALTGMEALVGIPGTLGGAVIMNAGSRGTEIKDIVREVEVLNEDGRVLSISREKLEFSYRHLKIKNGSIITSATFRLEKGEREEIESRIKEYQKMRTDSQPLNFPNLGSTFKNPQPEKGKKKKIYAAELIEEAGLKNIRVGGARVSEKHANFIINEREATAKDVFILINLVRDKVKEKTGYLLETEIKIVGED